MGIGGSVLSILTQFLSTDHLTLWWIHTPIHTLNNSTVQSVVPVFRFGVCLSVILLIVDPQQYSGCSIRSGVTLCTLFMVLYSDRMCLLGLHAVLWSHISTLIRRLVAEPRSSTRLLFPSQCPSITFLLTALAKAGPMLF